jgi:hypothetical protein
VGRYLTTAQPFSRRGYALDVMTSIRGSGATGNFVEDDAIQPDTPDSGLKGNSTKTAEKLKTAFTPFWPREQTARVVIPP